MTGYILTVISAIFLAITVIFDKLLIADFYEGSVKIPWFISTALGSILGIIATLLIWTIIDLNGFLDLSLRMISEKITFGSLTLSVGLATFLAGIATSQTLRHYFLCFKNTVPAMVAMTIAVTPVFVFGAELLVSNTSWQSLHFVSLAIATIGLLGYEWTVLDHETTRIRDKLFHLSALVIYSVIYLIALDQILLFLETDLSLVPTHAAAAIMPFYFLGFGTGAITVLRNDVRAFLKHAFIGGKFLLTILVLEVVGMSFYLFEAFGLAELNATLVALIVGAHVVIVWSFDLYFEKLRSTAVNNNDNEVTFLYFSIPVEEIPTGSNIYVQAISIALVLTGIALWP